MMCVCFPVVSCEYITTPVIPIPCCPLVWLMVWKREPNKSRPNALSIDAYGMPGPLS